MKQLDIVVSPPAFVWDHNLKIPCGFKILLPSSKSTLEINAIN